MLSIIALFSYEQKIKQSQEHSIKLSYDSGLAKIGNECVFFSLKFNSSHQFRPWKFFSEEKKASRKKTGNNSK